MVAPDRIVSGDGASCALWFNGPAWDGVPCATLGQLVGATPEALAVVLEEAIAVLAGAGCRAILGPMDGATWFSYRIVTDAGTRPPFLLEPRPDPIVLAALKAAGFAPVAEYVSTVAPLATLRRGIAGSGTLRLRAFDRERAEDDLRLLYRLSVTGFAGNAFYTPIAEADFRALYTPVLRLLDPEFLLFAEDDAGETLGFAFALPNYAEGQAPRSLIFKTYAALKPGVGSVLADALHRRARERGFTEVIHAFMHADNQSLKHSQLLGAEVFRRYALFGKRLPP